MRELNAAYSEANRIAANDEARCGLPISAFDTAVGETPDAPASLSLLQPSKARAARNCSGETPCSMGPVSELCLYLSCFLRAKERAAAMAEGPREQCERHIRDRASAASAIRSSGSPVHGA